MLEVRNLVKHFPITGGVFKTVVGHVKAVDGVSFTIRRGETLGLVGESGCGKTTTGRLLLRLLEPTAGEVVFEGRNMLGLATGDMRAQRRNMQIIFQDPFASLNPRMTVGDIIGGSRSSSTARRAAGSSGPASRSCWRSSACSPTTRSATRTSSAAGSASASASRARSALNPKLIVCDEPVSALDVSIQAQIINLLEDLQERFGLTYLFIAHDLSVVKHISDRVAVMYLGRIVEMADTPTVFDAAAASLHGGAPRGRSRARSRPRAEADRAAGRRAQPEQPAAGMPLPHALPVRLRPLQVRASGAGGRRRRAPRLLSPAHGPQLRSASRDVICCGGVEGGSQPE